MSASLSGRRWAGPAPEVERLAEALAQGTGRPRALCAVLARLGVVTGGAEAYLAPTLRDLLPDPRSLMDMEAAAARLCAAVAGAERIAVFADYDVDGGASAALLLRWLRSLGRGATLYVPDRIDEGYGPNAPAMAALAADHDLIVCVDCGTVSVEPIAAASAADVIVLDHHLGGEVLPSALAVVNPNRQDETGDLGHLCAAGVVFLCLVEANRQRRAAGLPGPDLMALLDLVAVATVADVAPLIGVNRAFVRRGLQVMAGRGNAGLAALADVARLDGPVAAYHLGFILGPRINAGGRVGRADLGARLLATGDPAEAAGLAARLDALNTERRGIEARVRDAALDQVAARGSAGGLAWAAGPGWHPGVVGIVAARVKEATHRPAVVIGVQDGVGKGSGRSVPGVDLGAAIQRLAAEGLALKGGGHRMAAGLTVAEDRIEVAMARLDALIAGQMPPGSGAGDLRLDGVVMAEAATIDLIAALDRAGPFGAGAPAPRFAVPGLRVADLRIVGEGHLKLRLSGEAGGRLDAIAFGAAATPLGEGLAAAAGRRLHAAGRLEVNRWQGRETVQLRLEDAALA